MNRTILEKIRNKIRFKGKRRIQKELDKREMLIAQSVEQQKEIIDDANRQNERKALFRREQERFLYGK